MFDMSPTFLYSPYTMGNVGITFLLTSCRCNPPMIKLLTCTPTHIHVHMYSLTESQLDA